MEAKLTSCQYCCEFCGESWRYQGGRKMRLSTFEKYVIEHQGEYFKCAGCGNIHAFSDIGTVSIAERFS